jgi:hypothetical protein
VGVEGQKADAGWTWRLAHVQRRGVDVMLWAPLAAESTWLVDLERKRKRKGK